MKSQTTLFSLALAFIILLFNGALHAQCPFSAFTYGVTASAPTTPGTSLIIETCVFVNEYSTVTNVQNGASYAVDISGGAASYVVIYDNNFAPIAWGASPVTFTAAYSGTYYSTSFTNSSCGDSDPTFSCNVETWNNTTSIPVQYATSCSAYTWSTNNQTYSSSGVYLDSTLAVGGGYEYTSLDLTVVFDPMDLLVLASGNTLTSQSTTGNYQWIDCVTNLPINGATNQSFTPSQTGNYAVIISDGSCSDTSVCSSIMVPIYNSATICDDYTWTFNNQTYSGAGTYVDSIQISGGFQTAYLVLSTVINPSDLIVTNSSNVLTSQSTSGTYQWIDCATNLPISGATNQSFEPTQAGSYAVIISDSSCVDTSACTVVQGVGLEEGSQTMLTIVPNPTSDFVTISFDGNSAVLIITDLQGKIIRSDQVKSGGKIDLSRFDSGVYFFNLSVDGRNEIHRVIRM